ncbi:MAG: DNA-binding protein WhiA [Candidatus Sericytochromatia bacterium]|nr:DNA-binding protein WhiA [Candidatus Sericytochromatia bacterium]
MRNQLAQVPLERPCCRQAHLLAFAIVAGSEAEALNGQAHLVFQVDNAAIARHLFKLGKALYAASPLIETRADPEHLRPTVHRVAIPIGPSGMLPATVTVVQLQEAIARKVCCRRAFLRGAFMAGGSLVAPTKAYHLEFNAPEGVAHWIQALLRQERIPARCYQRAQADAWTVYVKDGSAIATFLTQLGATQALMRWEEVRIGKDLVNTVQRVVNCETANLNRTLTSAQRQVAELTWLEQQGLLDGLPGDCREVARSRLELPFASLLELGATLEPPMSKSAVNHRLKLLHEAYVAAGGPPLGSPGTAPLEPSAG